MATKTIDRDTANLQERTARIESKIDTLTELTQDLHDKTDSTEKWREGVDTERRIVRAVTTLIAGALVTMTVNSCSLHPAVSPIVEPSTAIHVAAPTDNPTPTAEPTVALTHEPEQEPNETATPTPDQSATPTQIGPATLTVIEITPLGGERKVTGTYTTVSNQRARECPSVECDIVRTISAGQTLRFYDWRSWLPVEAWVCINVVCGEWMASTYEGREMGELIFD